MSKRNSGFTLVELVVVVMILGILAAVAAPRLLDTSRTATDNGVRQSLSVLRDAIDRFAAENGGDLPGADGNAATFATDLTDFLRAGTVPECPVGENAGSNTVLMDGDAVPTVATAGGQGWVYCYTTGTITVNSNQNDNSETPVAYSTY